MNPIKNRYDFVILFDVTNGNPNGDPDAGNMPRMDPESGLGIVTDVCLKHKIRNYVNDVMENAPGYSIYIKNDKTLNAKDTSALNHLGINDIKSEDGKKKAKEKDEEIRDYMCQNFFDIRTFGAVMTTFVTGKLNCGQVRGPVQLDFARSIEPIFPQEITITRMAVTKEDNAQDKHNTMGNKFVVPYALYRTEGYISANLARKVTGFSEEDLKLLWQAIINMFENDHSAARGKMTVRKLIVFKHDSELGNTPSYKLFERVHITPDHQGRPARSYNDYKVTIDISDSNPLPDGVTWKDMIEE